MNNLKIVLIDRDPCYTEKLSEFLGKSGMDVRPYNYPKDLMSSFCESKFIPDAFLISYDLPNITGADLISSMQLLLKRTIIIGLVESLQDKDPFKDFHSEGCQKVIKKCDFERVQEIIIRMKLSRDTHPDLVNTQKFYQQSAL